MSNILDKIKSWFTPQPASSIETAETLDELHDKINENFSQDSGDDGNDDSDD